MIIPQITTIKHIEDFIQHFGVKKSQFEIIEHFGKGQVTIYLYKVDAETFTKIEKEIERLKPIHIWFTYLEMGFTEYLILNIKRMFGKIVKWRNINKCK